MTTDDKITKFFTDLQVELQKEVDCNDEEFTIIDYFRCQCDHIDRVCTHGVLYANELCQETDRENLLSAFHFLSRFRRTITKTIELNKIKI
ncbi:MAG TPA: hypothetical protein PKK00_12825 [Bacteroidales bacterium]|nr:hypothetical protein [Bacteroidales bacterium]HPS18119.1 hypothetical protein [Bacteroidales bacterium]